MKSHYELVYIVDLSVAEPDKVMEKIAALINLKKLKVDDWGVKKFAYPIKKQKQGHYFVTKFVLESHLLPSFKEKLRWFKEILRFLVINLDNEKHFRYPKFQRKMHSKSFVSTTIKKTTSAPKNVGNKTTKTEKN